MKSVTFENLKKQNYTMKESLRALKTNIQFCGDDICTIVVTSAMPNEGKSTVTMDLARSFSESGKRVLLIDTDMRNPYTWDDYGQWLRMEEKSMDYPIFCPDRENSKTYFTVQRFRACL